MGGHFTKSLMCQKVSGIDTYLLVCRLKVSKDTIDRYQFLNKSFLGIGPLRVSFSHVTSLVE